VIEYREDVPAADFLSLVDRVWRGKYDQQRVIEALARTLHIGAWSGLTLVGSVRVLTDGYLFATVPEIRASTRSCGGAASEAAALMSIATGIKVF
jgi:hypothetical protein